MENTQPLNPIEVRVSTRTYREEPLLPADLERITSYLNDPANLVGPFGNRFQFELVIETEIQESQKIGTYGFIQNAQGYILGASRVDPEGLFDYAFIFEDIVLHLTELGIGTCWLGGRFRKQHAMSHLSLGEGEVIPAITPVGYPNERPRLRDQVLKTILRARKRKPADQLFFYETFEQPLGDRAGEFQRALHYVRVGPSAQNKQPWRLVFSKDLSRVHFYIVFALDDHPLYMCPPEYLDIGIAYNHFKAGLDEAGITGRLVREEPPIEKPDRSAYITSWHRDA
jgi:nitroreductase